MICLAKETCLKPGLTIIKDIVIRLDISQNSAYHAEEIYFSGQGVACNTIP